MHNILAAAHTSLGAVSRRRFSTDRTPKDALALCAASRTVKLKGKLTRPLDDTGGTCSRLSFTVFNT